MPLLFPAPFPNENAPDPRELFRFARSNWRQWQKFRGGQFTYADTIPANTIRAVTFTDTTVGGSDTGFDNLQPGMWATVTPPAGTNPGIQVDYGYSPGAGQLTVQLRNTTAGPIAVSGTCAYAGYVLP